MTVDPDDKIWFTANNANAGSPISAMRFDPETETWDTVENINLKGYCGIAPGDDGIMWMNYGRKAGQIVHGIAWIDIDSMEILGTFDIGGITNRVNGISLDAQGRVWTIAPSENTAYRYDPETQQLDSLGGLNYPYTYSDMTGRALQKSSCGPAG
jgi:streptogramin lyase